VSLHLPNLRGTGRRRAADKVTELREENVKLLTLLAGADDQFMLQDQRIKELEVENGDLKQQLAGEREARIGIERDRDAQERWIQHLQSELADAERRLDVRTWAEAAAAKTVEMPVIEVVPLYAAPFATTNPGRVRPAWAKTDPAA
jgi:chromosome segregation ATPase